MIADLLVGSGILCLAVGVYLLLGLAATLLLMGLVLIAAGVWWAVKNGVDRTQGK